MRALLITKTDNEKAKMHEFESLKEMERAGYNQNSFFKDWFKDFGVQEIIDGKDGLEQVATLFRAYEEDGVRVFYNSYDVDIFNID